jgi:hypothetical protein
MKNLIFACYLGSGESAEDALRLVRSLRTFGGEFCFNPFWILSRTEEDELSPDVRQELNATGARLVPFETDQTSVNFPFFSYVTAAAFAEALAQGDTSFLALMANDTLILQPPRLFTLPVGKSLGACPVHLKLLGSGFKEPLDGFWQLIYHGCRVDESHVFEMSTVVDEQPVRAYFNAGLVVVRPERGILRKWKSDFDDLIHQAEFNPYYQQSELYPIFMHQAVLAGSVLASLQPSEFQPFPFEVNYPLHLHSRIEPTRRIQNLEQLLTCRYEEFNEVFTDPELLKSIDIEKTLKDWLNTELSRRNPE